MADWLEQNSTARLIVAMQDTLLTALSESVIVLGLVRSSIEPLRCAQHK